MLLLPSAHRLFSMCVWVCVGDARERIVDVFGVFIPREQRQTAEGAEKPSGREHCSRGQSTPITPVSIAVANAPN